jgi:acyl phosphate:glycerol-3-phosphate acyltransferase
LDIIIAIIIFLISYLLGSISFARILIRLLKPGEDLENVAMPLPGREEPLRLLSVGGNTASMKLGARGGCAVGLLDILKAFIPTLIVRILYPDQAYFFVAALGAFMGHNWPIYYRFKGGRGISPFYGGIFAIDPIGAVVVAVLSLLIGMFLLKELLFAYVGGVILLLPWFLITKHNDSLFVYYIIYTILVNILFVIGMIPEVKQIIDYRKKYGKGDMKASMEAFPMGQHMLKMMKKMGLTKETEESTGVKE